MKFKNNHPYLGKFSYVIDSKKYEFNGYFSLVDGCFFVTIITDTIIFNQPFHLPKICGYIPNEEVFFNFIECTFFSSSNKEVSYQAYEINYSSSDLSSVSGYDFASFQIIGLDRFFKKRLTVDTIDFEQKTRSSITHPPEVILLFDSGIVKCWLNRYWSVENKLESSNTYFITELVIRSTKTLSKYVISSFANRLRSFITLLCYERCSFHSLTFSNSEVEVFCIGPDFKLHNSVSSILFPYFSVKDFDSDIVSKFELFVKAESLSVVADIANNSSQSLNYVDRFLNFVRGIELFSKSLLSSVSGGYTLNSEDIQLFSNWSGFNDKALFKDGPYLTYFKAFNYLKGTQLYDVLIGNKEFFICFVETRNYHTHLHIKKSNLWSANEIRKVTPHLKTFIHTLIWKYLGMNVVNLNKVYKMEQHFLPSSSPEVNPDSIYFQYPVDFFKT